MSYGSVGNTNEERATNNMNDEDVKRSKDNILGWYFYSFSSEPFVVSAVATYIPLLLEKFARRNGVSVSDHTVKCAASQGKCVLGMFNNRIFIDTSSFALYTFSMSVLFQAVIVITVSGIVDVWKSVKAKKFVLLFFGILGSLATMYMAKLHHDQYYLLAVMCIISNCCYGVVNVVGNSLLPVFVSHYLKHNSNVDKDIDNETASISGCGAALGYLSALIVQIISIFLVKRSQSRENIQVATFFVGCWWLLFQLPMIWLLRDNLVFEQNELIEQNEFERVRMAEKLSYLKFGWTSLFDAIKNARLLKDVAIFLVGWFILSDSVTTINSTAILFAKTELNMTTLNIIILSILTMISAIMGAFVIPQYISKTFHVSSEKTLLYIIYWAAFIPLYGIVGFFFKQIGLKHKFEMYVTAVWYGISLGGMSAVSRSVFSLIIPRGQESTFFSLFNVTDKGSSILGPFLVGLITDKTHEIRFSFFLLFALLVASIPIFNSLDVSRGQKEAEQWQAYQDARTSNY